MQEKEKSTKLSFSSYGAKISYGMPSIRMPEMKVKSAQQKPLPKISEIKAELIDPEIESNPEVWFEAGNSNIANKKYKESIECYTRAIALKSDHLFSIYNRAGAFLALGNLESALRDYQLSEKIDPNLFLAKYNAGAVLQKMGLKKEALECFLRVLMIQPSHVESLYNAGCILLEEKKYKQSLEYFDRALRVNNSIAEIHNNRATALQKLGDKFNALKGYQYALSINPKMADANCNYGILLADFNRHEEAANSLKMGISLGASSASAWHVLGMSQSELGKKKEALASLQKAMTLDSDEAGLLSDMLHMKMKLCDWEGLGELRKRVIEQVDSGLVPVNPFSFITSFDDLLRQRKAAEKYVKELFGSQNSSVAKPLKKSGGKIRIGYYSSDFQEHATMHLIVEMLLAHSHDDFEWFAFNLGDKEEGVMRARVQRAMDHFIDVQDWSDEQIAQKSRELNIDIAVDLKGFTGNSRFGIFYRRCAPIQVAYIGYPGTCGASCIDYIIADRIVIPEKYACGYTENVIRMPGCYQANNSKRKTSAMELTREDVGLPRDSFVYCSFNGNYKITPEQFDRWMEILSEVKNSVLWVYVDSDIAQENLIQAALARGVDSRRLVFAKPMKNEEHLARYKLADLFLDTYPCNAHTTASDALWAGVPVLTHAGQSFASRVAASLLSALDMPDLITHSPGEYVARAVEIGDSRARLNDLKDRLGYNRKNADLFDGKLFAENLEMAFRVVYERYLNGLEPTALNMAE
jgi:predicted O-linked N-acetylglucosamine transferase (SPINDLY family)